MRKIIAVVGMPGSGKSEAVDVLVKKGFQKVYFGDVLFDYMKKHSIKMNQKNERLNREKLRRMHGMAVMAKLSMKKVREALKKGDVVIESMYSMEEYLLVKNKYRDNLYVLAIFASPKMRYARLMKRPKRPLRNIKECELRDTTELQSLNKGGPIALADYTIINEGTMEDLKASVEDALKKIR
jgi:dephospho-CoA kinase